jgi:hypothetical protein
MRHVSGIYMTGCALPMCRSSIEARGGQSSERFMPRRRIKDSTGLSPGLSLVLQSCVLYIAVQNGLPFSDRSTTIQKLSNENQCNPSGPDGSNDPRFARRPTLSSPKRSTGLTLRLYNPRVAYFLEGNA